MVGIEVLERVTLLEKLTRDQLEKIQPLCESLAYRRDQQIFQEGEDAEHIFFVARGKVALRFELPGRTSGSETNMTTIVAGKSFGWSSLVEPFEYALSAYGASDDCRVCRVRSADLIELFDRHPDIGYGFMSVLARMISKRFHALQDEMARIQGYSIIEKW